MFWPDEESQRLHAALALVSDEELPNVYARVRDNEKLRHAVKREYVARYARELRNVPVEGIASLRADLETKTKLSVAERWQLETLKGKK